MKKALSILLTAVLLLSLLIGCGDSASSQETSSIQAETSTITETVSVEPSAPAEDTVEEAVPSAQEPEEETAAASISYPIDTDVTLTLFDQFNSMNASDLCEGFADSWFWQTAQENTGISIDFVITSADAYSTQFNLVIASGDYYDLMGGFGQYYSGSIDAAVDEGIILDIATLSESCPDYIRVLGNNDGQYLRDAETDTGVIGAFYTIDDTPQAVDQGLYVRQDWLDDLGMDAPVTIDQFTETLKAFKTEKGAAQPLYLGSTMGASYMSCYDIGALYDTMGGVPLMQIDGTIYMQCLTDGFKDVLTMMHGWYEDGLISNDFANQDDNALMTSQAMSEALLNGQSGVVFGSTNTTTDLEEQARTLDDNWAFNPIANPVLEEGQTLHIGVAPLSNVDGNGYAISGTCADPEIAAMFCNYFYTDEGCMLRSFGQQGTTYEIGQDGEPYFTEYFFANEDYSRGQVMSNYFLASNVGLIYANRFLSTKHERTQEFMDCWASNYDCEYNLNSHYSMTTEENDTYTGLLGDLSTSLQENVLKFITGDRSLDEIDAFQQEMRDMGAEELVEVVQAAYTRYLAR